MDVFPFLQAQRQVLVPVHLTLSITHPFRIYPPRHNLLTTFRMYPPPSEFTHHLQNLHTTFIIYPPLQDLPSTFRNYPPPSEFTHHLQNLPTTIIIYPPPSEFTHPFRPNKLTLGPVDLFGQTQRRCSSLWDVGEI